MTEPFTVKKGGFSFTVEKSSKGSGLDAFDAAYFTASCDTEAVNKDYAKQLKLDYPILSDPDKKVAKSYGVVTATRGLPYRWTFFIGKDGKILHIEKSVKPASHDKQIVEKLKELKVGSAKAKQKKPA